MPRDWLSGEVILHSAEGSGFALRKARLGYETAFDWSSLC